MNHKIFVLIAALTVLMLSGCNLGGGPAAGTPTSTSAPASPTVPAPTTGAPTVVVQPTETPKTAEGKTLLDALNKSAAATRYRFTMDLTLGLTQKGALQETPFMNSTGEVVGSDMHLTFKGGMFSAAAGTGQIEFIAIGQETYMKGVQSSGGGAPMDPNQWYLLPPEQAGIVQVISISPKDFLTRYTAADITEGGFAAGGTENLDGQVCQVWTGDRASFPLATFLRGNANAQRQLLVIDRAEFKAWTCADGFLYQVSTSLSGHAKDAPADKGSFTVKVHLSNFGDPAIVIAAPPDAKPIPTAAPEQPTPTP